jgi:nicotinamidase/pyrazinamidase
MTFRLDRERDALLIVDVQPDFMAGGALATEEGQDVAAPIAALLERRLVDTVVATQDWHPPGHISFASAHEGAAPFETIELYGHDQVLWPDHCVQGTPGAAIHAGLPRAPISMILRKGQNPLIDSYSGFRDNHGPEPARRETGLSGYLRTRGISRAIICGLALDVCVTWTALDAVEMGFEAIVIEDLCRPVSAHGGEKIIDTLKNAGVLLTTSAEL